MSLLGGVIPITGITFLVFCVFTIAALGYALGRVTIKGVSRGTAGVFIIALVAVVLVSQLLSYYSEEVFSMLISTQPDSTGKAAALRRARQLTEFRWTPLRDVPAYKKGVGKTVLPAGEERIGMIYSSTEPTDKFITENISFETIISIINNPDSALYTKDLGGHNNSWASFGLVCNGLARYALNIRRRYSTKHWADVPGMRKIADEGAYSAEEIELCDVLYAFGPKRSHVAFITDILRDEDGTIRQIEVSEAVRPVCVRRRYELEEFFEKYNLFALWRYDFVDSVPEPDNEDFEKVSAPDIAVDYGNKTNYRTSDEVVISAFGDGENEIEIYRGDEVIEKLVISGRGRASRTFSRGYYVVKHINTGECVEFCVTEPQITHRAENGEITVTVNSCDAQSRILYMDFREKTKEERREENITEDLDSSVKFYSNNCASLSKVEELTDEEKKSGVITRRIPADAGNFKIYFENKYGIWTHEMIKI